MQFKKIAFFIISATLFFSACDSKNENSENINKQNIEKKSKEFKITTHNAIELNINIEEKIIKIQELKGKVILLNFFAPWCPPCKAEIPHLNNLKNKYRDNFEVLAINLGERDAQMTSDENMNDFIKTYEINYLVSNNKINYDIADAMGGIRTIPTMFLLDTEGNITQKYVGIVPEEMIETDIKKVLGK